MESAIKLVGEFGFSRTLTSAEKTVLDEWSDGRLSSAQAMFDYAPGFWCQWVPNDAGTALTWNNKGLSHSFVEWLVLLISKFFTPWYITLDGEVTYFGADPTRQAGILTVTSNAVLVDRF